MSEEARTISKFGKLKDFYGEKFNLHLNIQNGKFVVYQGGFGHTFDTLTYLEYWLNGFTNGYKECEERFK